MLVESVKDFDFLIFWLSFDLFWVQLAVKDAVHKRRTVVNQFNEIIFQFLGSSWNVWLHSVLSPIQCSCMSAFVNCDIIQSIMIFHQSISFLQDNSVYPWLHFGNSLALPNATAQAVTVPLHQLQSHHQQHQPLSSANHIVTWVWTWTVIEQVLQINA